MPAAGRIIARSAAGQDEERPAAKPPTPPKAASKTSAQPRPAARSEGLSFTQRHRLDALPAEIDRLAAEIGKLEELLADPGLYARDPGRFDKATKALAERQGRLDAAEIEWLELEFQRELHG